MSKNQLPLKRIRYYSLLDGSGYGTSAFSYMEALEERGFEIIWSPMVWTKYGMAPWQMLPESMQEPLSETSDRQCRFIQTIDSTDNYDILIMHTVPEVYPKLVESEKYNIGYTVWETDKLPKHWPDCIRAIDHLMVPCKNNVELFSLKEGPKVSIVPHLPEFLLSDIQNSETNNFRAKHNIAENDFVFYNINSWTPRKAMKETLLCYLRAFTEKDNVCLILKTDETGMDFKQGITHTNKSTRSMVDEILTPFDEPPKVVLIDHTIPEEELLELHFVSDCFYSLTHSEGWGLGAYGAAALGKPVIITGWGGQTDFLPEQLSYLVDYNLEKVIERLNWESYTADQSWAYAESNSAIEHLQHVFHNQDEARVKGAKLAEYIADEFSNKKIVDQLVNVIEGCNE